MSGRSTATSCGSRSSRCGWAGKRCGAATTTSTSSRSATTTATSSTRSAPSRTTMASASTTATPCASSSVPGSSSKIFSSLDRSHSPRETAGWFCLDRAPSLSGTDCEAFCGILRTFRSLGGIADNVRYGHGARGRGLFAIDTARPVRVQVPRALLFPTTSLRLAGRALTLAADSAIGTTERTFFTIYQSGLSWAGGGSAEVVDFLALLQALPERARRCLADDLGLAHLLAHHDEAAILERFVRARHFDFHGRAVLMPILELCNHARDGADFDVGPDHVGVTGRFEHGEVLLRYGVADSWQRFIQYGFVAEERPAYSLPLEIRLPRGRLVIGHDAAAR